MRFLFTCICMCAFVVAFPQNTPTSDHPLLDKYYPHPQNAVDTAKKITTPVYAAPAPRVSPPPVVIAQPVLPKPPPKPVIDTAEKVMPTTATVSKIQTSSAVKDTLSTKTITATVQAPVPQKQPTVARPPSTPSLDTRLGSSSPQYDTYEKNSNGAGSVTTSPK